MEKVILRNLLATWWKQIFALLAIIGFFAFAKWNSLHPQTMKGYYERVRESDVPKTIGEQAAKYSVGPLTEGDKRDIAACAELCFREQINSYLASEASHTSIAVEPWTIEEIQKPWVNACSKNCAAKHSVIWEEPIDLPTDDHEK